MTQAAVTGDLTLGHLITAAGLDPHDVLVVRHTYTDYEDGLRSPSDLTDARVLDYTRRQGLTSKVGQNPPRLWLCFMADGGLQSRFLAAYENHGEVVAERTDTLRFFDLRSSSALSSLVGRLVVQWTKDTVNWAKRGTAADRFRVIQIADLPKVPFPGFDRILITHDELRSVVADPRYRDWQAALSEVQGVYVVADTSSGQLYVGKADGAERILGRWAAYARTGHGGNTALRALAGLDAAHARHFQYSLLRVFGPSVPTAEIDAAEAHFKQALLTRDRGLNRN